MPSSADSGDKPPGPRAATVDDLERFVAQLRQDNERALAQLRQDAERLREDSAQQFRALNSRIDRIETVTTRALRKVDELTERFDRVERNVEDQGLYVGKLRENERRLAGIGPYREPVRPETETLINSNSAFVWQRRPATPRLG